MVKRTHCAQCSDSGPLYECYGGALSVSCRPTYSHNNDEWGWNAFVGSLSQQLFAEFSFSSMPLRLYFISTSHLATKCDAELGGKKDIWSLCSPYVTHACVVGDRPCIIHSWSPLWHFRDPPSFSPRGLKHGANNLKAVLGRHEKGCYF